MTLFLLLGLLIGYIVMVGIFLATVWGSTRRAKWLGIATITAAAPFFYWLGAFSEQFGAGQCYSNAINMIANAVEATDSPQALSKQIRDLPTHGYETVCSQVEEASRKLPNAGMP